MALHVAQIIGVFPEGWMTSGNISRDSTHPPFSRLPGPRLPCRAVSVIKKKMETDPSRYEDYTG